MNRFLICVLFYSLGGHFLLADVVELQDGTRIEGTILAENPDSIEIQVGSNEAGTIRRVLIIDASEIRTWMADAARRTSGREENAVRHLDGKAYVEKLLSEAQLKIDRKDFTSGIREFGQAAEVAGKDVDKLDPADRVGMLRLKVNAYRLQLAALKGNENYLSESIDVLEDRLDELEDAYEDDVDKYEEAKSTMEVELDPTRQEIGQRFTQDDLARLEQNMAQRTRQYRAARKTLRDNIADLKRQILETEMSMELSEEYEDQASDELKTAERSRR